MTAVLAERKLPTKYLETHSTDPAFNLAFEEYVLCNRTDGDYLILWQNDNSIIIGQNQNAEAEINRAFVDEYHIHVVRRSTGGGAVYHDLGNLNYSFITDAVNPAEFTIQHFTGPIVNALRGLGLQAEASGRNDILVNGSKVSGTAQRLEKNRILHHGTLLFDSDPQMIEGALKADPAKFQSKSARSVRSRITNIRGALTQDMELSQFWVYLKECLLTGENEQGMLSAEELDRVAHLKEEKYATWEWNFGRSPRFNFSNRCRWSGGTLEVKAEIVEGRVASIRFYGDFLSLRSLNEVEQALLRKPFDKKAFSVALDGFLTEQFFGAITKEEILNTVFG